MGLKFVRLSLIKRSRESLIHLDELYKDVISTCPLLTRIGYCESLIYRSKEYLTASKCKIEKRKLKKLLKATGTELQKLKNSPTSML